MSDSPTVTPATGWATDTPSYTEGTYIWRRTVTTYGDGTTTTGAPVVVTGNSGTAGEDATLLHIDSSAGMAFKNSEISTTLTVTIIRGGKMITTSDAMHAEFGAGAYLQWLWKRIDDDVFGVISSSDSRLSNGGFSFTISPADVDIKTVFQCELIV